MLFHGEKGKIIDFSEPILAHVIKTGSCYYQLNDYINIYEYQRSRSFSDLFPKSLRFNLWKLLLRYLETSGPNEAKFRGASIG